MPTIGLDLWGLETARVENTQQQPRKYTSYERDANSSDEAMHRRYGPLRQRFDQPDPSDASYDLTDPQSLNRYAYVNNDPVNFVDPSGLMPRFPDASQGWSSFADGFWGYSEGRHRSRRFGDDNIDRMLRDPREFGWWSVVFGWDAWGGFWPQNPTPLDEAARIAEIALSVNQACRDLFGANVNPVQLLRDLRNGRAGVGSLTYSDLGGVSTDGTIRNANTTGNRRGVTMRINSNPAAPFQTGYANAPGGSAFRASLSNGINNAITLIHELGHAAMALYGNNATRITRDRANETASVANSRLVFETCFVY